MESKRKSHLTLIAIILILMAGKVYAEPLPLSVEDLANIFSTYFPKVEGKLLEIRDGEATLNLGESNGLVKGLILEIVRPGEPFYHPVSHEELGRFEDLLGVVEVESVGDLTSRGRVSVLKGDPAPGDRVRLSAAKIPVLITGEDEKRNLGMMDEFSRYLSLTDRFRTTVKAESSKELPGITEPKEEAKYLFRVHSLADQKVKIELVNAPFEHLIDELTAVSGGTFQ